MEHNITDEIVKVLQSFVDCFDKLDKETANGAINYMEDVYRDINPEPKKEGDNYFSQNLQ